MRSRFIPVVLAPPIHVYDGSAIPEGRLRSALPYMGLSNTTMIVTFM